MKEGLGTKVWKDGKKYQGYWKTDLRHGHGAMFYPDKFKIFSRWYEDFPEGIGYMWRPGKKERVIHSHQGVMI